MNFSNELGDKAIPDVMQTYPEIGEILARFDIGCTTCSGNHGGAMLSRVGHHGYAALLRDHISKEDGILYPLAERVIPETMRTGILQGYQTGKGRD